MKGAPCQCMLLLHGYPAGSLARTERAPGTALEDLHALAGCDYLIGPPSTFGAWASFHGDVPRYTIMAADHRPRLDEFILCRDRP